MRTSPISKSFAVAAVAAAGVSLLAAGPGAASPRQAAAAKPLTVVMHDPGCHWFSVGGAFKRSVTMRGPVSLLNVDEAALKIVGPSGTKRLAVGKRAILPRGSYRITMVGQEPDDNTLRLTVG